MLSLGVVVEDARRLFFEAGIVRQQEGAIQLGNVPIEIRVVLFVQQASLKSLERRPFKLSRMDHGAIWICVEKAAPGVAGTPGRLHRAGMCLVLAWRRPLKGRPRGLCRARLDQVGTADFPHRLIWCRGHLSSAFDL